MSKITLINSDCIPVLKSMADKSANLILCDPPYGVNLKYDIYEDTEANWFKLMSTFLPEAIRVAQMVIMPSCQIKKLEWIYKNFPPSWLIAWNKGSTGTNSAIGFNDWEPLLVYGKNKGICMHDYFYARNDEKMGSHGHPCPKPLAWNKWLISRSTQKGDLVCDPMMGVGGSGIACKELDRDFIGIELSAAYFATAKQRIEFNTQEHFL